MATKTLKWMLAVGIVAGLLGNRPVYGCGPFVERAIFTYTVHPDLPLTGYAQGQLGILQPTYARSYLYVAYRYLIGIGVSSRGPGGAPISMARAAQSASRPLARQCQRSHQGLVGGARAGRRCRTTPAGHRVQSAGGPQWPVLLP
jgi:hypothetical protein